KARALSETYVAFTEERIVRRALNDAGIMEVIDQNFDSLSFLSGSATDVEAELSRRAGARPPDQNAARLRSAMPAARLSSLYQRLAAARTARTQLTTRYGADLVTLVDQNIGNLYWVLRPVEQIETELRNRRDEAVVRSVVTTSGFSVG